MSAVASFRDEDRDLFEAVRDGRKRVEVRAATPRFADLVAGQTLTLQCGDEKIAKRITHVQRFISVEDLLVAHDATELMPGFELVQFRKRMAEFPGYAEKIKRHGLVTFALEEAH